MPEMLIKRLDDAPVVKGRWNLLRQSVSYLNVPKDLATGLNLEFGVFKGTSLGIISSVVWPRPVYGFDSFLGLPEPWDHGDKVYEKGLFNLNEDFPTDIETNVTLVQGWFEETLPKFLKKHPEPARFINVDCDIYSSTKAILEALNDRILPGTVIHFDELGNWDGQYPGWENHEYKALVEWMSDHGRWVEPIARSDDQAAVVRVVQ